jgi:aspartyl aminopeptidase
MIFSIKNFIQNSPTPLHAVQSLENQFISNGFENSENSISNYKSYKKGRGSFFAWQKPKGKIKNVVILGAHTDSPCLKIRVNPEEIKAGVKTLAIEVYGGVLWNSWLDRDLGLAGELIFQDSEGNTWSKLIKKEWGLRVPQLAIHLDRGVNQEGLKLNPEKHLSPLLTHIENPGFKKLIQDELPANSEILSFDLYLYDQQAPCDGGAQNEFLYSARLDNLQSCYAGAKALCESEPTENTLQILACFDHEEVGSASAEGADSLQLRELIEELTEKRVLEVSKNSLFISADAAHALHPNFQDRHDIKRAPLLGKGVVVKINENQKYTTQAHTLALSKQIAKKAGLNLQTFQSRNDMGCGSTIGPMTASKIGFPAVDLGVPLLSMHSIREMCHNKDTDDLVSFIVQAFKGDFPIIKTWK